MELPFADRGSAAGGLAAGGLEFHLGHIPCGAPMRYPVDMLRKQEISKLEVQGKQIIWGRNSPYNHETGRAH